MDTFETIKDIQLFTRHFFFKSLYSKKSIVETKNAKTSKDIQSDKVLDTLVSLLEESDPTDLINSIKIVDLLQQQVDLNKTELPVDPPIFNKKSDKFPHLSENVNLSAFVNLVSADLKKDQEK